MPSADRPSLSRRKKLIFSLVPVVLLIGTAELMIRIWPSLLGTTAEQLESARLTVVRGESPAFGPSPHTVFRLRPGARNNSQGFVGREFEVAKPEGVLRIACLGGSTTQGGNPQGPRASYPFYLERLLQAQGQAVEVYNYGVSNWTTAETLVNYVLNVQDTQPDIVIVHHAINDVSPRIFPGFRSDYAHYRVPYHRLEIPWLERALLRVSDLYLALRLPEYTGLDITAHTVAPVGPGGYQGGDRPPAGTEVTFRRNLETIGLHVTLHGGRFVLMTMPTDPDQSERWPNFANGVLEHNEIMRELCREHGFGLIDMAAQAAEHPDIAARHFRDIVHVTPKGNEAKAKLAAKTLFD